MKKRLLHYFIIGAINILLIQFCYGQRLDDIAGIRLSAEQGNVEAAYYLGMIYINGTGVPRDEVKAFNWIKTAAEKGYAPAQDSLGIMYVNGQGVQRNAVEAIKWIKKAADQGLADGQNDLGAAFQHGQGVDKNLAEAAKWYQLAAKQGLASAQFNLGTLYMNGLGDISMPNIILALSTWRTKLFPKMKLKRSNGLKQQPSMVMQKPNIM